MTDVNAVKDVDEMMVDLEEYYEAAGFDDYHARVLSEMNEEEIRDCYRNTFETDANYELEELVLRAFCRKENH